MSDGGRKEITPIADQLWREQAACRGRHDIDWHMPLPTPGRVSKRRGKLLGTNGKAPNWTEKGRRICYLECPVRQECLDHALAERESGLWGGHTDRERAFIAAFRRGTTKPPPPCPVCDAPGVFTSTGKHRAICTINPTHRYGRQDDGAWRASAGADD